MSLVLDRAITILPVDDAARARSFYTEKLGLPHRGMASDGSDLLGNDSGPMLQLMPVSDGVHSAHTALSFEVPDVEATVRDLDTAGVRFEDYDLPDLKTENHICTTDSEKCAWFKDSEGNFLCVHQNLTSSPEYSV
jgi:catechol 2,3-dioxygenase-like lactoylglutathione lyase family enzyme